jgi:hypothetical protein
MLGAPDARRIEESNEYFNARNLKFFSIRRWVKTLGLGELIIAGLASMEFGW